MALPQDAAALNAMIQAAVAAAIAALPPPQAAAQAGGAALVPVPFHVNPAGVGNDIWDFRSPQGVKHFQLATAPIDPLFDGEPLKLNAFLKLIWSRADTYGFTMVLLVNDNHGVARDITREFGCLVAANLKDAAITYLRLEGRAHQASVLVRLLVMNSLQPRIIDRLYHRKDDYTVNIALPGAVADFREDGPCMILALINMVMIETRASVSIVMHKLTHLHKEMDDCKSNVEKFNTTVEGLVDELNARDVAVPDLLHHLFAAYGTCEDSTFIKYMARKEEEYEDGTIVTMPYTALMQMALEKYKTITQKEQWGKKTEGELEFIAMQTELKQLRQNPAKPKAPSTTRPGAATPTGPNRATRNAGKFAWKGVAPKAGEAHEKTVEGKNYIFCPHHGTTKWVLKVNQQGIEHKTGCRMMAEANAQRANAAVDPNADRLTAALANVAEEGGVEETI
jgi:hypothetical protein